MISDYTAQKMRAVGAAPGVTNSMVAHRKDGFIIHGK